MKNAGESRTLKVRKVHQSQRDDLEDLVTFRAIPTPSLSMESSDPFIFLNHHGPQTYPPGSHGLPFGPHPHRGFETVTFILDGSLLHKDSGGYESVISAGGIQWMTAGSGIVHAELSPEEFKRKGGPIEILQLWVNLPSRLKMTPPKYVGLQKDQIPVVVRDGVEIHLVSGFWAGEKGPVQSLTDVSLCWIRLPAGGHFLHAVPQGERPLCYVVRGNVRVNGTEVPALNAAEFSGRGGSLELEATENAVVLLGHGKSNDEPIAAYGPFVMNSQKEIVQAMDDYNAGRFGSWED